MTKKRAAAKVSQVPSTLTVTPDTKDRDMKSFVVIFPPALALVLFPGFSLSGMEVPWIHLLWFLPWVLDGGSWR